MSGRQKTATNDFKTTASTFLEALLAARRRPSAPRGACQVDLGLIAVGTAQSGEVRLRNVGTVPLAFAMVQTAASAAGAGTAAESAAEEESRTASMLRDLLVSQQQQRDCQKDCQQQQQQQHGQQGSDAPFAATTLAAAATTTQRHPEGGGNDQALARVFGAPPPPPPPPAENASGGPAMKHASTEGLLQRRNSEGSVGSSDSFSVSRDGCRLSFEPALGELAPGRSVTITVSSPNLRVLGGRRAGACFLSLYCSAVVHVYAGGGGGCVGGTDE